ncbi:MAG: hypothetical protein RLZZ50_936 [Verrucomicrobiota bacterium]|jgi:predicted protein tyrosine phosphatase
MERKHADRIREKYPDECAGKTIIVLRVPDDFPAMDHPDLIELLRSLLPAHLPAM